MSKQFANAIRHVIDNSAGIYVPTVSGLVLMDTYIYPFCQHYCELWK